MKTTATTEAVSSRGWKSVWKAANRSEATPVPEKN